VSKFAPLRWLKLPDLLGDGWGDNFIDFYSRRQDTSLSFVQNIPIVRGIGDLSIESGNSLVQLPIAAPSFSKLPQRRRLSAYPLFTNGVLSTRLSPKALFQNKLEPRVNTLIKGFREQTSFFDSDFLAKTNGYADEGVTLNTSGFKAVDQSLSLESSSVEEIADLEYVLGWNRLALDTASKSNLGPTVAARLYSKLAAVQYDSWAVFDEKALGAYYNSSKQSNLIDLLADAGVSNTALSQFANQYESASDSTKDFLSDALRQAVISRGARDVLVEIQNSMITDVKVLEKLNDNANSLLDWQLSTISNRVPSFSTIINEISIDLSGKISSAILQDALKDGANQLNLYVDTTNYTPTTSVYDSTSSSPVFDSEWQPLTGQIALTPHWGQVSTFAVDVDNLLPESVVGPYTESGLLNQEYIDEINEVLDFSSSLSATERAIAEFWEGGIDTPTPPGLWLDQLDQIITSRELNLDQTIELNMKASQAMFDASIATWNTKYSFNTVRPGTSIRQIFADTQLSDGSFGVDFVPYLEVPPFPDIASGHSAFSASFNYVLIDFFKSNRFGGSAVLADESSLYTENGFDGLKDVGEDIVLSWDTFSQAAEQAGLSRLYGAIHTRSGDLIGQKTGYQVGATVNSKVDQLLQGSSLILEDDLPIQWFGTMKSDLLDADVDQDLDSFSVREMYGFRGDDTLIAHGGSPYHLYGGMDVDQFQIWNGSDVIIRDYEINELIAFDKSFFDDDASLDQIVLFDPGLSTPFTDVMIDSRRLVRLDGRWDKSQINISLFDDANSVASNEFDQAFPDTLSSGIDSVRTYPTNALGFEEDELTGELIMFDDGEANNTIDLDVQSDLIPEIDRDFIVAGSNLDDGTIETDSDTGLLVTGELGKLDNILIADFLTQGLDFSAKALILDLFM
jgi:hypothetical protein